MPKRVIDGDALWRSDKLAMVSPEWIRAEYACLIPLAYSNGSFEAGARRIWSNVYSYNRPSVTLEMVEQILAELERVKLLFRWTDDAGKVCGYWVGIEKPGRLPGESRRGTNEVIGPVPPEDQLRKFMESNGIQKLPHGNEKLLGFGFGSCISSGSLSEDKPPSDVSTATPSKKQAAPKVKKHVDRDPRHAPVRDAFQSAWKESNNAPSCPWEVGEAGRLAQVLKSVPDWNVSHFCQAIENLFKSDDFYCKGNPKAVMSNIVGCFASPLVKKPSFNQVPVAVANRSIPAREFLRQREAQ